MKTYFFLLLASVTFPQLSRAQSTISTTDRYIYSANAGWIDLRPSAVDGVRVMESYFSGYAYAANFGWISFGNGSPFNGYSYANNTSTDCGVNLGSDGALSGYAYAANVGWITFEPLYGQPRLNFVTGKFTGFIYSANLGWISLDTSFSDLVASNIAYPDTDGDGIADAWEMKRFGALPLSNGSSNFDNDEQTDKAEYEADTLPQDPNSLLRVISHSYNLGYTQSTLQFSTSPSRLYRIETSNSLLGTWTNSAFGAFTPDAGTFTTRTVNFTGAPQFFRAIAVRPLQ